MHPWVGVALLSVLAAVLVGSCSDSDSSGAGAAAGTAGFPTAGTGGAGTSGQAGTSAATAGSAGGPALGGWQPLSQWGGHLAQVPDLSTSLDCGPGCRVIVPAPSKYLSGYAHGSDEQGVYDLLLNSLALASYGGTSVEQLTPPEGGSWSLLMPSRWGSLISFNQYKYPTGQVMVWDRAKGQVRTFLRYTQSQDKEVLDGGVYRTVVNDRYVFWLRDRAGLFRADLTTGETTQLSPVAPICDRLSALSKGLLCSTGQVVVIDQETGQTRALDPTSALQMDGAGSNDRTQVVWIDYRDPPGPTGTTDALRGGEVYLHTLTTSETRRLTFDSPGSPRLKRQPFVDGDWVVWTEMPEDKPPTVDWASEFYGTADRLVRLEVSTGKKCRLAHTGGRVTLNNHHLFMHWIDPAEPDPMRSYYLVDLDLDHPDLPWKCE